VIKNEEMHSMSVNAMSSSTAPGLSAGAGLSPKDQFRQAMRKMASTVTIVTAMDGQRPRALVATSVTSVSVEPPALLVCANKDASIHPVLRVGAKLCVNLLSESDLDIAAHFISSKSDDRFHWGDWRHDDRGAPWLASAQACIFAAVVSQVDWHTHSVIFAHVASTIVKEETLPLLYANGAFGMLRPLSE
jgi:flavin reductase (DIM6/NTAB) family NADH-FMN oxidoreductase RutF